MSWNKQVFIYLINYIFMTYIQTHWGAVF